MALRPTQAFTFFQVSSGIQYNLEIMARAQQQVATGKRILRPSDDAVGSSISLSLRRQAGKIDSYLESIGAARPTLATAASELQQASTLLTEARATIIQGMNGTNSPDDRAALADQLDLMRDTLLGIANSRSGERYLFSGTETGSAAYVERDIGGMTRAVYDGNEQRQRVVAGLDVEVEINVVGAEVFEGDGYASTLYGSLTGIQAGTTADSGTGYYDLFLRHTATVGGLGEGIQLAGGGASDTILGDHALVVDAAAGTIRLGTGPEVSIPGPTEPGSDNLVLKDADGSEVHLDVSGWTGNGLSTVLTGEGDISFDGSSYQAIDFTETDLELVHPDTGAVIHVDTTSVSREGRELVTFSGATNLFDSLAGIAQDLRNPDGLEFSRAIERIQDRLQEFDDGTANLLSGLGQLGSRVSRLDNAETRLRDVDLHLQGLISEEEDADITEVILEMTRAEQTLNVAQATGARLIQNTLLNYIR